MANEPANGECETAAIRDLQSRELDAVGGGGLRVDEVARVTHRYYGPIDAFLDGFYSTCGCERP